jgi:hypothetical protein
LFRWNFANFLPRLASNYDLLMSTSQRAEITQGTTTPGPSFLFRFFLYYTHRCRALAVDTIVGRDIILPPALLLEKSIALI